MDPDNFLSRNECGFHCKNDFNRMIEFVKLFLNNNDLYSRYSQNSYDYVKRNHDINKNSKEWINLFKKIMQLKIKIKNHKKAEIIDRIKVHYFKEIKL